jgi:hypothetical protein
MQQDADIQSTFGTFITEDDALMMIKTHAWLSSNQAILPSLSLATWSQP